MNTLKEARIRAGLKQSETAKKAGIHERQYQDYEYGNREPGARTAIRIARALNSTVEDIWGEAEGTETERR